MDEQRPWHRYLGLGWMVVLGPAAAVEAELDLSKKVQQLDLAITWVPGGKPCIALPDGFENMGRFNLVTFKSHQEALDTWALDEAVGHFVNFRKQISPSLKSLLSIEEFRRFAICVRTPRDLMNAVTLTPLQPGVYEARHFSGVIRVVVIHELPLTPNNAMLLLFSAKKETVEYAARHFAPTPETSSLLHEMIHRYEKEGLPMILDIKEFAREVRLRQFQEASAEERLALLQHATPEERLEGLSPEERLKGLTPEQRAALVRLLSESEK